jgi:peroxiredoxin
MITRTPAATAPLLLAAALLGAPVPCGGGHVTDPMKLMWQRPEVGKGPHDFTLPDPGGTEHRLADRRGEVFLLSFWSCYADSCSTAIRSINVLLTDYGDRGLSALTVCSEVPPALAREKYRALQKQCETGQTLLVDGDKEVTDKYRLHLQSLPVMYLVGRDFLVKEIVTENARLREKGFRRKIERLLSGASE